MNPGQVLALIDLAWGFFIGLAASGACTAVMVMRLGYSDFWTLNIGCVAGYVYGSVATFVVIMLLCVLAFMPPSINP